MQRESTKIYYKKGYKYQLNREFTVYIPFLKDFNFKGRYAKIVDGWVTLFVGYAWDGASGPTFDTKSTFRASAVHDLLYWLIAHGYLESFYQYKCDKVLYRLMREDKAYRWRAKLWLKTLKWKGKATKKKELVAP